jgi:hypothetical protein
MPASSEKQRKFMAVERSKKRKGEKTSVKMSDKQLTDFMHKDGHMKREHHRGRRKSRHSALGSKYRPTHVGM